MLLNIKNMQLLQGLHLAHRIYIIATFYCISSDDLIGKKILD